MLPESKSSQVKWQLGEYKIVFVVGIIDHVCLDKKREKDLLKLYLLVPRKYSKILYVVNCALAFARCSLSREMIQFWNLKFNNCGKHRILTSFELKLWTSTHYLHLSSWSQPSSSPSSWSQLCRILTSFYEALNITAQLECAKKGMDFFPLWFLFAIVAMNILLVIEDFFRVISYSIFEVLGKQNVFLYWGLI